MNVLFLKVFEHLKVIYNLCMSISSCIHVSVVFLLLDCYFTVNYKMGSIVFRWPTKKHLYAQPSPKKYTFIFLPRRSPSNQNMIKLHIWVNVCMNLLKVNFMIQSWQLKTNRHINFQLKRKYYDTKSNYKIEFDFSNS